jgi:uncharacterized protein (TIGR02996 family)
MSTMTDHDAFLQAVLDDPTDDLPRLVYADWLEEAGDVRAEFIRSQITLERLPTDAPGRPALETHCRALQKENQNDWLGALRELLDGWEFCRGFVEKIIITPELFVAHAESIFRAAPVRHVHFFRRPQVRLGEVRSLAWSSHLGRLHTLKLNTDRGLNDEGVRVLAGSPYLSGLLALDLSDNWIRNTGAQVLAHSPYLGRLGSLQLGRNLIGKEGKQALRERFGPRVCF